MFFVWDNIFLSGTKLILPGTKDILSVQMAWAIVNFLRESQEKSENSNIEYRPTKKNHSELNRSVGINSQSRIAVTTRRKFEN